MRNKGLKVSSTNTRSVGASGPELESSGRVRDFHQRRFLRRAGRGASGRAAQWAGAQAFLKWAIAVQQRTSHGIGFPPLDAEG